MKKYLIVVDLDDTLLRNDKSISTFTKQILRKCQGLGHKIVVNTARSYMRCLDFAQEIDADYICAFNGNLLCNREQDILWNRAIPMNISKNVIDNIAKYTDRIVNEGLFTSLCINQKDTSFLRSQHASISFVRMLESYKLIIRCNSNTYSSFKAQIAMYDLSTTFSRDKNTIRIMPPNSDKWYGIQKLKEIIGQGYSVMAFGDDITDYMTLRNADIGVRMENSVTELIETIDFITTSNEDDGVARFLCHYFNLEEDRINYQNVKVLDCSLRDGGHLNQSCFGRGVIKRFIEMISKAKVDIIEIGFLHDVSYDEDIAIYPNVFDAERFLEQVNTGESIISLMTQVDKFDISKLEPCKGKVKMIRVSFHNDLIEQGIQYCEIVKSKGYLCSVNPINFSHYTNEQVIELIKKVNRINPDVFSIVDTFGVLLNKDFRNKLNLLNHLLNRNIQKGIHLHDNLDLSFASAQTFIETNSFDGTIIIDASISGLGRSPGNLRTEIVTYYINLMCKERYSMEYIYRLIEKDIPRLKEQLNWSKDFAYSISAFENVHRSYAEYLMNHGFCLSEIEKLIKRIPAEYRGRFCEDVIARISSSD